MHPKVLVAGGLGGVAAVGGWLALELLRQNGRLLLRVEALDRRFDVLDGANSSREPVRGLPAGTVVQDFDLPTLNGKRMRLSAWRGHRLLLIFFSPDCGFCQQMVPDLARLSPEPTDGRPVPLIVTSGGLEENRRFFETAAVRCPILVQEDREVARLYRVDGTPMAYLMDEQGRIASPLVAGTKPVLALAEARLPTDVGTSKPVQRPSLDGMVTRAPTRSRINRSGLPAGTPAPGFRLPRLDGGELDLEELHGRKLLLVFSDPACGPCNQLAPQLERVYRDGLDAQVLMVGRGSPEANRAKVAEFGLSFPVVLQRHWDISRAYGMFATPIGYLIDEQGVIAADVAQGAEAILNLAKTLAGRDRQKKEAAVATSLSSQRARDNA